MGSNEEIIQLLQKTQTIFKQTQRDKEEKYLNDIIQLQDKIKDLENVVCKMGRSTDTLRLLTNEQKAFRDNLHKSGVGYNGSCVLSQAYAKIPKLYRASELCDKNEQLHVFDSEETLEDAEKSQLKMNEFQKDEKIQELKIQPIDYEKLNKLYKEFVPQKQLSEPSVKQVLHLILFPLLRFWKQKPCRVYFDDFQNLFQRDIKKMKDAFEQNDIYLDEIENQNDLLKDQLLEASLAEDIKNLVITSCVEIRNKDLHDETERISKELKDILNDSKTADTVCNDAFEFTQELSIRIVELEKDLLKFEAKGIALEITLQHKSRENNSLKTLQKENENFMASLQIENAHLKQTYKDLFDSFKGQELRLIIFNNIFGKIEFFEKKQLDISELNKESGEKHNLFENETSVFQIKIDELENSLAKQIKEISDLLIKIDNLENVFADEEKRATLGKLNAFDNVNCDFESKVIHLEKVIAQKSKDFDDVNLEKLEKTKVVLERQLASKVDDSKAEKDRFLKEINHLRNQLENQKGKRVETKLDNSSILGKTPLLNNERDQLLKQIASFESKLASQDIHSCQKEYHELRISYNALKVKFDSLNRKKWNINVSKSLM
ncbi:hypothetical protein Tco_1365786 [Tanacetum coccineum]